MLVWSVLTLGAGVWAKLSVTSRAGITISRNTLFMESSERFSPCGGLKFRLGFVSASDSGVEPSRLSGSGVRTWSIQVKPNDLIAKEFECLFQIAHLASSKGRRLSGRGLRASASDGVERNPTDGKTSSLVRN